MAPQHHNTILLAEDDELDEILFRHALRKSGQNVELRVVHDGIEVLRDMRENGLPAVLFLDMSMPRMDGLRTLVEIRNDPKLKDVPVVMLSTSDEPQELSDSYRLGASSYLRKPIDFDEFLRQIKLAVSYWLSLNIRPGSRARVAPSLSQ